MDQVTFDLDSDKSEIRVIDESDRPVVMESKTLSRIELKACIVFTNPLQHSVLVCQADPLLLRRRKFRKSKRLEWGWIHPGNQNTSTLKEKGLQLPAQSKNIAYLLKWKIKLPDEFKYDWLDSSYFIKLTVGLLGRPSYSKKFDIELVGLREGKLTSE